MASLLWGGLFTFLFLYALVCSLLWLKPLGRAVRHPLRFTLVPTYPESGDPALVHFPDWRAPLVPPGFRAFLKLQAVHSAHRQTSAVWKIPLTGEALVFQTTLLRGLHALTFSLEIRDVLGFCRVSRTFPGRDTLSILPRWADAEQPRYPSRGPGDKLDRTRKVRSQELLETRKYHPGDDIRRLHWGLYAHLGEPFLRIGEENPPPAGKLFFLVDPSVPSRNHREEVLDDRLARCRTFLGELTQPWVCLFPQLGLPAQDYQDGGAEGWARTAAALRAQEPDLDTLAEWVTAPRFVGELQNSCIQIISAPGCPGLAALAGALSRLGITSRPLLLPLTPVPGVSSQAWWQKKSPESV